MMCIRNKNWLDNDDLKADLTRYIREGLSRIEILDFVRWDHSIYRDVGTTWYLVRLFKLKQ